jgi:hypothetical protein
VNANAQEYAPKYHSHNFYLHVGVNSGNIYPFAGWSILSGVLNSALKYNLFESGFAYDIYSGEGVSTKYNSPIAFSAVSIFNHLNPEIKIGYYSAYISSPFNWGILATGGYKINQFQMQEMDRYTRQCIHRAQVGAMLLLAVGKNGASTQAMIEVGAKYNFATQYKAGEISDINALNNGLTSHFALKFGGSGWLQNVGVYADIDHYTLFNSSYEVDGIKPFDNNKLKNITIGVCVTVTPSQANRRRDY